MTFLSTLGFQPRKSKELIAPTSIGFPDISVVLPVKNNQKGVTLFLSEFLKTHPPSRYPREIIIVDNDSQPPISIPAECVIDGLNITVLRSSAPGPACARNLGIMHSQTEWVLFTDSDCILAQTFLLGYFEAMNGSIGYAGTVKAWGRDHLSLYYESQEVLTPPPMRGDGVRRPEYVNTANTLIWRPALEDIGGFDESITIAAGEDIDLGLRLREIGNLSFAPVACVYHNFDDGLVGFVRRFLRYGKGNKIINRLYTLDLTPRIFRAKQPTIFNLIFSRIQYLCLYLGYRMG